jgi:acetyl-CoA carboxylase biotin carboxyl carrier protein
MMSEISINADMAATVWKIHKSNGDAVSSGDVIMILESMKMEIPIEADGSGVIANIAVEEGDPVEEGQLLVQIN